MTETEPIPIDEPAPTPAERVAACRAAIAKVLHEHRCVIVSRLDVKPVGGNPISEALNTATYSVEPLE